MPHFIAPTLPADVFDRLRGADPVATLGKAIQIFTVGEDGWPHAAMIGYGEVVALDPSRLRLAARRESRTAANMRRTGQVTLAVVDTRLAYYLKGHVRQLAESIPSDEASAKFEVALEQVLVDAPDPEQEPGVFIAGGVTYVNPDRDAEVERARRTLADLRS